MVWNPRYIVPYFKIRTSNSMVMMEFWDKFPVFFTKLQISRAQRGKFNFVKNEGNLSQISGKGMILLINPTVAWNTETIALHPGKFHEILKPLHCIQGNFKSREISNKSLFYVSMYFTQPWDYNRNPLSASVLSIESVYYLSNGHT